jgi:hypothetical protein
MASGAVDGFVLRKPPTSTNRHSFQRAARNRFKINQIETTSFNRFQLVLELLHFKRISGCISVVDLLVVHQEDDQGKSCVISLLAVLVLLISGSCGSRFSRQLKRIGSLRHYKEVLIVSSIEFQHQS